MVTEKDIKKILTSLSTEEIGAILVSLWITYNTLSSPTAKKQTKNLFHKLSNLNIDEY